MTFNEMSPDDFRLIVAAPGGDGGWELREGEPPARFDIPGAISSRYFWDIKGVGSLIDDIGGTPLQRVTFPLPGGSQLRVVHFPANSSGKVDVAGVVGHDAEVGQGGDPSMHASDTIDYDIVLSGKIDIEVPGGVRTLVPGDLLVMAGTPHAWHNRYDEPCTFVAVLVGATREA